MKMNISVQRKNKSKNNFKERILSLMVFLGIFFGRDKSERSRCISSLCSVELFVVVTSKIMRCHHSTVCVREGQTFVKRNQTFPALLNFLLYFYAFLKIVLPNLISGDFIYFNLTHPYLWTRNHIKYSPPGPFCGSISALNYKSYDFFFIGGFGSQ